MALVEETVNRVIRDIINLITGVAEFAISAKQNAPRPTTEYCSVDMITLNRVGWEENKMTDRIVDPDIDSSLAGYRELMFSLNFYRTGAYDNASAVQIGFMRNSVLELLRAANLGLGKRSEVRDISDRLERGWEERAQFDLIISAIGTDTDIITSISGIDIVGDFQTSGSQLPITIKV